MELDFKLEKVIEVFDLVKRMSWGSIPLWFSITIPLFYIAYTKMLPERTPERTGDPDAKTSGTQSLSIKGSQMIVKWFTLPRIDKVVVYTSLCFFIIGTITLMIDQNQKEAIRKNGLRLKQYFLSKNNYNIPRTNLTEGDSKLVRLNPGDIDDVLEQYPNEFLEVDKNTIILRDSLYFNKIIENNEKLLNSYLSDPAVPNLQDVEKLFDITPNFFTREVVYKLIADSSHKYSFCVLSSGNIGIKRKL